MLIWDANTRRATWLDSSIRDPLNVLIWSKTGPNLAIGSYRGNLMLYNHRTSRKVPVLGKHSKAITCGAWSESNLLVCINSFSYPNSLRNRIPKEFQEESKKIPKGFQKDSKRITKEFQKDFQRIPKGSLRIFPKDSSQGIPPK